jgi:hypothetical protein
MMVVAPIANDVRATGVADVAGAVGGSSVALRLGIKRLKRRKAPCVAVHTASELDRST